MTLGHIQARRSLSHDFVLCAVLVAGFLALKVPTISLPAYLDETYVVAGGWQVLHNAFSPFPPGAEMWGHPPVGFELAALTWLVLPQRIWALHLLSVAMAVLALVFTYRVGKVLWSTSVGAMAAVMLAVSPLFFAQAGILQLDLFATTFAIMAVYALIRGRWLSYFLCASLVLLSKENSVCFIPAMVSYVWLKSRKVQGPARMRQLALSVSPVLSFLVWVVAHRAVTGYWWGDAIAVAANKEIVWNNLEAGLGKRFGIRWIQLLNPDRSGLLPMVFLIAAVKWLGHVRGRQNANPTFTSVVFNDPSVTLILAAVLAYLVFHTLLGVLHPRYLLPVVPLVFLISAVLLAYVFGRRAPYALAIIVPAFVVGWFRTPDKFAAAEANLDYIHIVKVHEVASAFLEEHYPNATVVASLFQSGANLANPIFGYVERSMKVCPVGRTSAGAIPWPAEFDLVYSSSSDQFGEEVKRFVRARGLRESRTFTSGHYSVRVYPTKTPLMDYSSPSSIPNCALRSQQ